jgi:hypothetical protein
MVSLAWLRRVTLAVCLAATCSVRVQADDRAHAAGYQTSIEQAVREFGLGNYAEARALFRRAHGISPNARTLRGMGMAAFELKLYVDALRELSGALENKARPLTEEQRVQVQALLDQSRAFVGRYQLVLTPATAKPSIDNQPAQLDSGNVLLLGLGEHVLSAAAEGYQEVRVPLHVDGGEDLVLRVELASDGSGTAAAPPRPTQPPAPTATVSAEPTLAQSAANGTQPSAASSGLTTAAWITAGGSVVFAGVAVATWLVGNSRESNLERTCAPGCSEASLASLKRADVLTSVFLGAAVVAAGAAAALFVIDLSGSGEKQPEQRALYISPQAVSLRGRF